MMLFPAIQTIPVTVDDCSRNASKVDRRNLRPFHKHYSVRSFPKQEFRMTVSHDMNMGRGMIVEIDDDSIAADSK